MGNHFRSKGYCVAPAGLNEDMIRKYVKYQEKYFLYKFFIFYHALKKLNSLVRFFAEYIFI